MPAALAVTTLGSGPSGLLRLPRTLPGRCCWMGGTSARISSGSAAGSEQRDLESVARDIVAAIR